MLLRNIRFICGEYWRKARSLYVYWFLGLIATLGTPLLSVYLPQMVVRSVVEKWPLEELLKPLGAIIILMAGLMILSTKATTYFEVKKMAGRLALGSRYLKMVMNCDYVLLEDPKWQMRKEEAEDTIYSDGIGYGVAGMVYQLHEFVITAFGITTFSIILGILHPAILLILAFTSLLPGLIGNVVSQYDFKNRDKARPYEREINYLYNDITTSRAGKELRIYNAADFFLKRMQAAVLKRLLYVKRVVYRRLGEAGVAALMLFVQNGVALGYLAFEIIHGHIDLASFALYASSTVEFTQFVNQFVKSFTMLKKCCLDVEVLRQLLEESEREDEGDAVEGLSKAPSIRFEHVSFTYPGGEKPVLEDISFYAAPGEKIALVGENGAGKTTLVKLLCRFYTPTKGKIYINEKPIESLSKAECYSLYSAVFQDMLVLPFSVLENVTIGSDSDVTKARACLEKAGLSQRFPNINQPLVKGIQRGAQNLSGGEEQRLLLARALYKDAPVLVLDEPTAALDPLAESALYEQYNELTEQKTSFFISHRLASTRFCDRILLLEEGQITEEGSHEELLKNAKTYARMFHEQSKYYQEVQA